MNNNFKELFNKDSFSIAEELLGKIFVRRFNNIVYEGIITEVEVYTENDEASHSYNKRKTARNLTMFKAAGHIYVYFTYGMYHCCNIVTNSKDVGEAILIRSLIPIKNILKVRQNRFKDKQISENQIYRELLNGPAKICVGFEISKNDDGKTIYSHDFAIKDYGIKIDSFLKLKRIGISKNTEKLWRYKANRLIWRDYSYYIKDDLDRNIFDNYYLKKFK